MTKKNIIAASLLIAFSVSLSAQETKEGGFGQNWFIGAGAGVNSLNSLGAGNGFDGRITPSAEVYFGKWFSPKVGTRFGWQGVSMATAKDAPTSITKMGMSYTHGDLLFNATSWLTPYVHAGALTGWKLVGSGKDNEIAMGAGLIGNVRISDHAALYMDIRSSLLPQRFAGVEDARFSMLSSATAGIYYTLSDGNRTRTLATSYAEKDYNPVLGGFWDNWFIQTGAGVNTMASKRNGHGWNGRITPALETLVGKWFSPTFGARLGWQGLTFSQWGREASDNVFIANGIYKGGEMDKEKTGFNYIHGDILWDFTRTVAGYNPERLISVIPYLHAGYMNEYTVNKVPSRTFNNEWAAGAGLLNNVRIDDKMGVYFDMRAFLLTRTTTGDNLSGYAYAASATAGLYYNLGKPGFKTNASSWSDYSEELNGSDWFISSGYGINLFGSLKDSGYAPRVTPAYEVSFGRWVNPYFGGRFGVQGLSYSQFGSDPKNHALVGVGGNGKEPYMEKAGFAYVHGDLLWNLSNQLGGINPDRTVSFIPYYHFGLTDVFKSTNGSQANRDFGVGGGLLTNILLSNRLSAYIDARATGYPSKMSLDKSTAYVLGLAFMGGLTWNLGGDSWTRTAETAGTDAYDSLLDNWFIQIGGGINTFASKRHNVGFGGRITPATEVAIGKWLSPTFGIRAGWQGLTFSQWGEYPIPEVNFGEGVYKGRDVYKEKFGFNYVHADLMWDVTDSFGGYNPDRFWRVVPYLHGGMVNAYSINDIVNKTFENELAGGAGLLNFFRLNDRTSLYADFRASTMAAKLSGDTHSGRTFSASILSGLAYS
ncbi:MAG: hypothetical protein MJZ16_07660, partial [Bacteroidales bacterium]|nr:hypothetical protein [Bacteroidales bacterium]